MVVGAECVQIGHSESVLRCARFLQASLVRAVGKTQDHRLATAMNQAIWS